MNKVLLAALAVFVILSILLTYEYYNSSILYAETSGNYNGVCTQYTYVSGSFNGTLNPLYNATACNALELDTDHAGAVLGVFVILLFVDVVFMFLYWLFEVREANVVKQSKK